MRRGRRGGPENSATMRHMARARLDERVPATRDAVQLPAASSVGVLARSRAPSYRVVPSPACSPFSGSAEPFLSLVVVPLGSKMPSLCVSLPFCLFPFLLILRAHVSQPSLLSSLALGCPETASFHVVPLRRGTNFQASPDMSGPPRREIRGIPASGIACAPTFSLTPPPAPRSDSSPPPSLPSPPPFISSSSSSFFSSPAPRFAEEDIKRSLSLPTRLRYLR